jgi:hypothetical protein
MRLANENMATVKIPIPTASIAQRTGRPYWIDSNSTSKISVAFGGIVGGRPCGP